MILTLPSLKILRAGEERIARAQARGLPGDDPDLPFRWVSVTRDGTTLSVAVGPVDYGEADQELYETVLEVR